MLVASASAGGIKRIKKEKDFRALIVDKKLIVDGGWFSLGPEGTSVGEFRGKKWVGAWKWSKGYYCSAGRMDRKELPADCKLVKSDGSSLQLTDNKGKGGRTITYVLK